MIPQVAEFHRSFGLLVATTPALPDTELRTLRRRLLAEEIAEVEEAERNCDIVQIGAELADVCYIAAGTALTYGLWNQETEVHQTCLRTGDIEYSFLHFSAISGSTPGFPDTNNGGFALDYLLHIHNMYEDAESKNDFNEIARALSNTFSACYAYARAYGINLTDVFNEIHASNMTKLGDDGKPVRRADGKVLKGPNYRKHNVRAIIEPTMSVGHTYRHYKGSLYCVDGLATIEATLEPAVIYRSVQHGGIWIRTCRDFFGEVELPNGKFVKRFVRRL